MFGNVTARVGWTCMEEVQEQKHAAHMIQACGLGCSQVMSPARDPHTVLGYLKGQP